MSLGRPTVTAYIAMLWYIGLLKGQRGGNLHNAAVGADRIA